MNAPRIALFLPRLSLYGGVETFGWRLAEALVGEGYQVDFVCARQETEAPTGVNVVRLGRHGLTRAGKMIWFAWAAERTRAKGNYDLTIGMGKTLRQDLLRVSGGPLENFWKLSARAWPPGKEREWKSLRRRLSPANAVIRSIERQQLRNAKNIVTVSHTTVNWLAKDYPWLDTDKIKVVYNRPDLERFKPCSKEKRAALRKALGIAEDEMAVTVAGTSFHRKGVRALIAALPLLPSHFKLYVAGGRGSEPFLSQARTLGVAERVRFLGRVDNMPEFYPVSDVFALPTLHDTCANAVPEALACGVKVVGSVDDGSSFFLPERRVVQNPDDPEELARAIILAAGEPDQEPFAWPEEVPCGLPPYLALVRELLEKKNNGTPSAKD